MKQAKRIIPLSALTLAISVFAGGTAHAEWIKSYGTQNSEFGSVMPSSQGGYYLSMLSAPTTSGSKPSALLSLLNNNGNPSWTKKVTTGAYDTFFLNELSNGRILLQGTTQQSSDGPGNAVWAIYNVNRTTGALSPVFRKTYKGKGDDQLFITQDSQGVLWATGSTTSFSQDDKARDMILAKIDANTGIPAWSKVYHYGYDDSVVAFIPKGTKFILLANIQTADAGSGKILLGQLNNLGVPVSGSFKEYGGNGLNSAINIKPISGGNYLVYGKHQNSRDDQNPTLFVMKLNSSLGYVWGKSYTAGADQGMYITDVNENADKSLTLTANLNTTLYIDVGGMHIPFGASSHPTAIQLSAAGVVTSTKSFEYQGVDSASLSRTDNGDYLLGGQTSDSIDPTKPVIPETDMLYGHFNATMAPTWVKTLGGQGIDSGFIRPQSTGYWLSGTTLSWGAGYMDVLAGKLDANGDVPGCKAINEVSMIETTPLITAGNLGWQGQAATLVKKGAITNTDITLNVTNSSFKTTNVCSN